MRLVDFNRFYVTDIARHVGLVAKDFDSIKRLDIERGIGKYLQLVFAKE